MLRVVTARVLACLRMLIAAPLARRELACQTRFSDDDSRLFFLLLRFDDL
jgi:hypothetical protein